MYMYMYICIHIYIYMYIYMCVCVCVRVCVCIITDRVAGCEWDAVDQLFESDPSILLSVDQLLTEIHLGSGSEHLLPWSRAQKSLNTEEPVPYLQKWPICGTN